MDAILDLLPVAAFLLAYWQFDIYVATGVLIVAMAARLAYSWIRHRKISGMLLLTGLLVLVLGGLTVWKHDPVFIKWKPSIADWAFAAVMLFTQFRDKTAIEHVVGSQVGTVPQAVWRRANLALIAVFFVCGVLNIYVAYNFSEAFWVKFKFIGLTAVQLVFSMAVLMWVMRHAEPEPDPKPAEKS